jgi:hypothetical protein
MVECLRPGGWLVDEDGDWGTVAPIDPSHPLYEPYRRIWARGPVVGRSRIRSRLWAEAAGIVRSAAAWGTIAHEVSGRGRARHEPVGAMVGSRRSKWSAGDRRGPWRHDGTSHKNEYAGPRQGQD